MGQRPVGCCIRISVGLLRCCSGLDSILHFFCVLFSWEALEKTSTLSRGHLDLIQASSPSGCGHLCSAKNSPGHLLPFPREVLVSHLQEFHPWVFPLPRARSAAAVFLEGRVSKLDVCPPELVCCGGKSCEGLSAIRVPTRQELLFGGIQFPLPPWGLNPGAAGKPKYPDR